MKYKILGLVLADLFALGLFAINILANPWGAIPDWVSSHVKFTMSVALADLDNDGDLDLVTGNYNYPYNYSGNPNEIQEDSIGSYLIGYQ